jgi:hypothetical protein
MDELDTEAFEDYCLEDENMFEDGQYLIYYKDKTGRKCIDWKASYGNLKESYAAEKHELVKSVARLTADKEDLQKENERLKNLAVKSYERFLNSESDKQSLPVTPSSSRQSEYGHRDDNFSEDQDSKPRKTKKRLHCPVAKNQVPDGEAKDPDVSILI